MPEHVPQGLSVPGSLLLAGEFAVLVEGGLGYTCAVDRRVQCRWRVGPQLTIHTRYGDQEFYWRPEQGQRDRFLDAAWQAVLPHLGNAQLWARYYITLDSTALLRADGRKAGLGSSAAAMVALVTALLYLHTKRRPPLARVFSLALAAHRRVQGGSGSGYDVACSTYGGVGLFAGGALPRFSPLASPPPPLGLMSADVPIVTKDAIAHWKKWSQQEPGRWNRYLEKSQEIVRQLVAAKRSEDFYTLLTRAAQLGKELNQALGIWDASNELVDPCPGDGQFYKAVGAGNELYVTSCAMQETQVLPFSAEGIQWH